MAEVYARTRSLKESEPIQPYTIVYGSGSPRVFDNETDFIGTEIDMSDNPTPDFKARMCQGEVIVSSMKSSKETRLTAAGQISFTDLERSLGPIVIEGDFARKLDRSATSMSAAAENAAVESVEAALIGAYSKMNKSDIMGGELLKDLSSTLGMIRRPFSSALDLLRRMTKERSRRAGKTAKSFAKATTDTWLEYRYGWRPVVGDVRTAVKLASASRNNAMSTSRRVVRTNREAETSISQQSESWLYDGSITVSLRGKVSDYIVCRTSAGIVFALFEPSNEAERWSRALGFTSKDVLPTAWECVPFSFVVDQFVGVGDWLNAVVPNPFVRVLGSWTVVKKTVVRTVEGSWSYYRQNYLPHDLGGPIPRGKYYLVSYERVRNPSMTTHPVIRGKMLGSQQIADDLSLITQKIISGLQTFKH